MTFKPLLAHSKTVSVKCRLKNSPLCSKDARTTRVVSGSGAASGSAELQPRWCHQTVTDTCDGFTHSKSLPANPCNFFQSFYTLFSWDKLWTVCEANSSKNTWCFEKKVNTTLWITTRDTTNWIHCFFCFFHFCVWLLLLHVKHVLWLCLWDLMSVQLNIKMKIEQR